MVFSLLFEHFIVNIGYVVIVKVLANEKYRQTGAYQKPFSILSNSIAPSDLRNERINIITQCPPAPSIAFVEYYLRKSDLESASLWMEHLTYASPDNEVSYLFPQEISLDSGGRMTLNWEPGVWAERQSDSNATEKSFCVRGDLAIISYSNTLHRRDYLIYTWLGGRDSPLPITCWNTIQLKAQLSEGTFLTFEMRIDGELRRYIHYETGNGEWKSFDIPIEGDELSHIYISLNEPSKDSTVPEYRIKIEPIKFLYK